ncbi:MAG TPA: PQQ-dependent sugar dehydrogenase, partial [Gemmataceae bacterium]|nr:PQQ-dependent sugar dehydrogenase [Gemmataceae bacterium]
MRRTGWQWLLAALLVLGAPWAGLAGAAVYPEGFVEQRLVTGLTGATAMAVAPDGRIFVCEQTGALRVVEHDVLLPRPFVTLKVDSSWERGLLGIAFDPDFAHTHHVYLNYISPDPYPHHRISRFTAAGDVAVPGSEVVLFEGDDQRKLGGGIQNGHQGGAIHFGKDGKLYVAIGDQTAGAPAQDLHTLLGKMLRLNRDGSIPPDNPFYRQTTGKYRAIWALGLRNPFTFAVQPGTGRIFINDVGGFNETINEGVAGANYGWPTVDRGPTADPRFRGPLYWYRESSITGGTFYDPPVSQFPAEYVGKYLFNDFKAGWIKVIDPDHPGHVSDFAKDVGTRNVVGLEVEADGSLLLLGRDAWVIDKDFRPHTGALYRVRYTGRKAPPVIAGAPAPQKVVAGGTAYFRVTASGSAPLRYRWQRNGKDLPTATDAALVLPAVARAD